MIETDEHRHHDEHIEREIEHLERENRELHEEIRQLERRVRKLENSNTATTAILTIGGPMPSTLSVDATDGTATLSYTDDHGDPATTPADAAPVFSSDTPAVLTIASDPTNPLVGDITPVAVGTANVSVTGLGTDTLTNSPIADPAPASVEIIAGPAADGTLVIAG